jgi:hypothetical protein
MPVVGWFRRWFALNWKLAGSALKVALAALLVGAAFVYAFFGPLVFDLAYWVLGKLAQALADRRFRIGMSVVSVAVCGLAVSLAGLTPRVSGGASPSSIIAADAKGPATARTTLATPTPTPTPAVTPAPPPTPTTAPTPPAILSPTPTVTPSSKSAFRTFGDGTYAVGTDIVAGTYRTREASPVCTWARLSGFDGTSSEIISYDYSDGPVVVTIAPSDTGFEASGCGAWTADLSSILAPGAQLPGDGTFIVGTDFKPGTYRSPAHAGCYWARLRGFGGTYGELIDNVYTDAQAIVTIRSSDKGFKTSRCGLWTRQ